jgi:hypothetical protein
MKLFKIAFLALLFSLPAAAQDPTKVDPQHYKVIFEDTSIRVLRLSYGAHEKSVMHEHPFGSCVIFLTEFHAKSTDPVGKVTTEDHMPGEVACDTYRRGTFQHLPENTGDAPFQVILIERKSAQVAFEPLGNPAAIAQLLLKIETATFSKPQ